MHNWRPTNRLDTVLDRSIDRLDEETPAAILREYPHSAGALTPMLHLAAALRDLSRLKMPLAAKQAGRARLRQAVLAQQRRRPRPGIAARSTGSATWIALILMITVGATSGITFAAKSALPDEPLYGWKRATEQVWLHVQPSAERRIAVSLALADRRVTEIKQLYQRAGRVDRDVITQLRADYTRTLDLITTLPPTKAQPLLEQAQALGAQHEQELAALAQQTTGSQQQILLSAVQISQWVQQTTSNQPIIPPTSAPVASATPTQSATPQATPTLLVPSSEPKQTAPALTPVPSAIPTSLPTSLPTVLPTVPPTVATPKPTDAPKPTKLPVERKPPTPEPTVQPERPTPAKPTATPEPTAQPLPPAPEPTAQPLPPAPEPTAAPPEPTSLPPTATPPEPTSPPKEPPGKPEPPGPPKEPPGRPEPPPGPPKEPPGRPEPPPGPTREPPGKQK